MTETEKRKKSSKAAGGRSGAAGHSKRGVAGWAGMLAFVSVWMFVLGVLVGRGTVSIDLSGPDEAREIAEELTHGAVSGKIGPRAAQEPPEKSDLDFYRRLKSSAEPSFEKRKSVKKSERKIVPPAEVVEKKAVVVPEKTQEQPKASSVSPPQKAEPAPPQKSVAKESGKYAIQVAALKDEADARKVVARLAKKGYDSYFVRAKGKDGGVWYRIRVGSFRDRQDASGTLLQLKKDKIDGFLVNK